MQELMKQAQQMQQKMTKMQEDLAKIEVEASVGGGMVSATVNGKKKVVKLQIDPEVVNPSSKTSNPEMTQKTPKSVKFETGFVFGEAKFSKFEDCSLN